MNVHSLAVGTPDDFSYLGVHVDRAAATYWATMHVVARGAAPVRPCFHPQLMHEMTQLQVAIGRELRGGDTSDLHHLILASAAPGVFNLGGDLDQFADCIERGDSQSLQRYAETCVEGVYNFHLGFGANVHTVALVQGDALGGGFEAALSCHSIVAEEGVEMGLPESIFGLFPGMGAYPFLRRRCGGQVAQRLIMSGKILRAEQLLEMGIIDAVVPRGCGVDAVHELVRSNRRRPRTWAAVAALRQQHEPISLKELMDGAEMWVEMAMSLDARSIKTMRRLVRAQTARHVAGSSEVRAAAL